MPQNAFFPQNHDLLVCQKMMQRHFFPTLHPLSPIIFATATVVAFVLLCNSRFNFHCYTQCEATPTQKSARKWRCDLSWLLARKITKGIHSCKTSSLNCPLNESDHEVWWFKKKKKNLLAFVTDTGQTLFWPPFLYLGTWSEVFWSWAASVLGWPSVNAGLYV